MDLDQVEADLRQIQEQIRDNLAKPSKNFAEN